MALLFLQGVDLTFELGGSFLDIGPELLGLRSEFVVRKGRKLFESCVDLRNDGLELLELTNAQRVPASRAIATSVAMHCEQSAKKTMIAMATTGVKTGRPSGRLASAMATVSL